MKLWTNCQTLKHWFKWGHFVTLLILLFFLLRQSSSEIFFSRLPAASANTSRQLILYMRDSSDPFDEEIFENTTIALNNARLNYDVFDLGSATLWPRLEQYSAILFVAEALEKVGSTQSQEIIDYVANGGGVVVAYRGWNRALAPLFGFTTGTTVDFIPETQAETGIQFVADFFPGVKGLALNPPFVPPHTMFNLWPPDNLSNQIIATTNSGRPVAWISQFGQGRTIFWNTDFLIRRDARGFLIQSILGAQPVGVLPIANVATFQIDDFPAAVSTQKIEPVKTEYDLSMVDFYNQVWAPDMLEISRQYNIPYTFLLPFNYNALIEPPFDFKEWEHATVSVDGQQMTYSVFVSHLLAQEHELGLHGYNHISLLVAPDYWIPKEEVGNWLYAHQILIAQSLITAWDSLEQLTPKEQSTGLSPLEQIEKEKAQKILDEAIELNLEDAYMIVEAAQTLEQLRLKEQQNITLTPKEQVDKDVAQQKINEVGNEKLSAARELVTLTNNEVATQVVNEARAILTGAGSEVIAQAETTVAQIEQLAEDNMATALTDSSARWDADNLGPQPVSYVPPNNLYHAAGMRALLRSFPSLKVMAGIYAGDFDTGGGREFSSAPWNPSFFSIPRVTSEYTLTPSNRFTMISMISMMGVWTHFVHPDDVFHTPQNYPLSDFHRNPNTLPWRGDHTGAKNGFYYRLIDWLNFNQAVFPWLRFARTNEALEILSTHLNNQITIDLGVDELAMFTDAPSYYFVRVNNGQRLDLNALRGAQFLYVYQGEGYRLYVLRGIKSDVRLKLLPPDNLEGYSLQPTVTPWVPDQPVLEDNLLNLQGTAIWLPPPVPTSEPTPTSTPTATPSYDVLPIPTPTLRNRP